MDTTFTPYARCIICRVPRLVDDIRILSPCAHSVCVKCIDSTFPRGRGPCPLCRTPIGIDSRDFAKPVSLEFIPIKVAQTELFVDGLGRMDEESKLVSVLRTPAKLQKAVDELKVDENLAKSLLQAVAEFKERIIPVFTEHAAQSDQLQELQTTLEDVKDQKKQIQELRAKSRSLKEQVLDTRRAQQHVETERDRAVELAEKAVRELNTIRNDNASLGARVSELDKEISKLKGILQAHKLAARKSKAKRKDMERRLAELEHKANDNEEAASKISVIVPQNVDMDDDSLNLTGVPRTDLRDHDVAVALSSLEPQFDFEGMPGPGFSSNWKPDEHRNMKRIKMTNDKVKEITNFPISLDRSGRPTVPIQLGPKRKLHVRDPLK